MMQMEIDKYVEQIKELKNEIKYLKSCNDKSTSKSKTNNYNNIIIQYYNNAPELTSPKINDLLKYHTQKYFNNNNKKCK